MIKKKLYEAFKIVWNMASKSLNNLLDIVMQKSKYRYVTPNKALHTAKRDESKKTSLERAEKEITVVISNALFKNHNKDPIVQERFDSVSCKKKENHDRLGSQHKNSVWGEGSSTGTEPRSP